MIGRGFTCFVKYDIVFRMTLPTLHSDASLLEASNHVSGFIAHRLSGVASEFCYCRTFPIEQPSVSVFHFFKWSWDSVTWSLNATQTFQLKNPPKFSAIHCLLWRVWLERNSSLKGKSHNSKFLSLNMLLNAASHAKETGIMSVRLDELLASLVTCF